MFITLEKKEFSSAVGIVSRFAERRAGTLPSLSGIALTVADRNITLQATNLETGIQLRIPGTIKKEGSVALPANVLREITNSFSSEGLLTLEQKEDVVIFSSGKARGTVKTLSYDDFPALPSPEDEKTKIILPGTLFKSLISTVASCASPSTVRPELASVFLSAENNTVKAVATDSFRLAEKKVPVEKGIIPFSVLIPAKNALDIVQTIPDSELTIVFGEHLASFSWNLGTVTTRLVALQYPDYTQIIPKTFSAEATILRKDFESALKRTAVFSDSFQKIRLGFDGKESSLVFSARNNDIGEASESIPARLTGGSLELSFNHRYIQAPLSLMHSESMTVSTAGIGRPLVLKGVGDTSFLYLVMPMNQ